MRKNNCEVIRQELDELMLDEACSAAAVEHLRSCDACREFKEKQTKLRRMVGSIGTVAAPADFDFRLRARLANDSSSTTFHLQSGYWTYARRSFALAAVLLVFATGAFLVRSVWDQPPTNQQITNNQPAQVPQAPPRQEETTAQGTTFNSEQLAAGSSNPPQASRRERPVPIGSKTRRPLVSQDFASERAEVIGATEAANVSAAFPLDASLESFRVSLDDGRGNARTISVPTISFGSQRVLQTGNQLAQKRVW